MHYIFIGIGLFSSVFTQECSKVRSNGHTRLNQELLCGYEKNVRPKLAKENATTVTIKMDLKSLDYNMHGAILTINSWLILTWKDDHLIWNPSDYEEIKTTHINTNQIWVPDLSMYNRAYQGGDPSALELTNCQVSNTGEVVCVPPNQHAALCVPNLTRFPFDTQNCTLRFGSWIHSGEEIDFQLTKPSVTTEDYMENGEWKLITVNASKHSGHFNCCPDNTYPSLKYSFVIERHSGFFTCMAVGPALVLITLTLASFCINYEEFARTIIIGCNLILHQLHICYLAWKLPIHGPEAPLILIYSRDSFILSAFLLIITILERKFSKIPSKIPTWISVSVGVIINSKPGRVIFLTDDYLKTLSNNAGEDDGANIIESTEAPVTNWKLLALIIDRLCFFIYTVIYFCMFIEFIP